MLKNLHVKEIPEYVYVMEQPKMKSLIEHKVFKHEELRQEAHEKMANHFGEVQTPKKSMIEQLQNLNLDILPREIALEKMLQGIRERIAEDWGEARDGKPPSTPLTRVLIVSTWRTGARFIGLLLASHPGTFYLNEPLLPKNLSHAFVLDKTDRNLPFIRDNFNCHFDLEYVALTTNMFLCKFTADLYLRKFT